VIIKGAVFKGGGVQTGSRVLISMMRTQERNSLRPPWAGENREEGWVEGGARGILDSLVCLFRLT